MSLVPRSERAARALRVAVDATPMLRARTGVGTFVAGALAALAQHDELDLRAYGLTWRGRRDLEWGSGRRPGASGA